jgi:hypothetical protein
MKPQTYFGIDNDENAWLLVQRNEVKTVFLQQYILYKKNYGMVSAPYFSVSYAII